jgi:hypothetical protein
MNKRFAQILTDATNPKTGEVNKQLLFRALEVDSSDPVAVIFDAAAFTFETTGQLKACMLDIINNRIRTLLAEFETIHRTHGAQCKASEQIVTNACLKISKETAYLNDGVQKQIHLCTNDMHTTVQSLLKETAQKLSCILHKTTSQLDEEASKLHSQCNGLLIKAQMLSTRLDMSFYIVMMVVFISGIVFGLALCRLWDKFHP